MATKTAKSNETVSNYTEKFKNTAKDINEFALDTTEEIVDIAIVRGEQWQKVADKAIKGGLKLAENQQDIMFDTLEVIKGQLQGSTKRFRNLFSKN